MVLGCRGLTPQEGCDSITILTAPLEQKDRQHMNNPTASKARHAALVPQISEMFISVENGQAIQRQTGVRHLTKNKVPHRGERFRVLMNFANPLPCDDVRGFDAGGIPVLGDEKETTLWCAAAGEVEEVRRLGKGYIVLGNITATSANAPHLLGGPLAHPATDAFRAIFLWSPLYANPWLGVISCGEGDELDLKADIVASWLVPGMFQ